MNLNTSYVKVPGFIMSYSLGGVVNLNTSYVKVPVPRYVKKQAKDWIFKYILCKGSSVLVVGPTVTELIFKYILCKGSRIYHVL